MPVDGFLSLYEEQRQHAQIGRNIPIISNVMLRHKKKRPISTTLLTIVCLLIASMPFLLWRSNLERALQSTQQASSVALGVEEFNVHGCLHGVAIGTDLKGTRGLLALMNSIISNYDPPLHVQPQNNNDQEGNEDQDQDENLCIFIFSNEKDMEERKQSVECAFGASNLQNVKIIHRIFDTRHWNPIIYSQNEAIQPEMEYKWFRYYLTPNDVDGLTKVLYLDTDMIVQGNIAELFQWGNDMNDHVVVATNYWEPLRNQLCQNHRLSDIHMNTDQIGWFGQTQTISPFDVPNHINTGLLLFDLEKMSSQRILHKWAKLLQMHNEECLWIEDYTGETDFTLAIKGDAEKLPDEWNVGNLGTPEKFRLIGGCERAKILHWNGESKPYTNSGRANAFCSEFFDKYDVVLQQGCYVNTE